MDMNSSLYICTFYINWHLQVQREWVWEVEVGLLASSCHIPHLHFKGWIHFNFASSLMAGAVWRAVARCHAEINSTERHYGIPVPASPCLSWRGSKPSAAAASIMTHCGGGEGVVSRASNKGSRRFHNHKGRYSKALKVPNRAFTIKILLRHYATQAPKHDK